MRRPVATVRARLSMLVLACIVPLSLMAAAWIGYDYRHAKEQLARDSIARARAIGSAIDLELAGIQGAMQALATSPHLAARDWTSFRRQAAPLARTLGVTNVVLVDAGFQQRVNTVRPEGGALPYDDNPLVRAIFASGKPLTSDLFTGPATGRPLIAVGIPVLANGKVAYVLGVGILPERLGDLLGTQRLDPDWIGAIFDSQGTVVARTHQREKFTGTKGAPALLERMRAGAEGYLETNTLEGIPVLSAFSRSAVSGWTVAIGIPSRELEADLWRAYGWLLGAMVIVAVGTLLLAWRIAETIAQPMRALTAMAERAGGGERLSEAQRLSLREAEEVAQALREAVEKQANAEHRAHHDPLTGLANRALFREIAARQIAVCRRESGSLAVLFIDLDDFKHVNDERGHAAGDDLLRAVGLRLKAAIRDSDLAARLGGDEFAVLLLAADAAAAAAVADKVVAALAEPYRLDGRPAQVTGSVGVAVYPASGQTAEELLMRADEAMYRAKLSGKRAYALA
jgi:diguanylate cyclase (GGDEF)-like protein